DDVETPAPTRQEWDHAEEVPLAHMPEHCHAWRVREWVRIQCMPKLEPVYRVALIAGEPRGVAVLMENRTGWREEGVVVFPVRRGDRRMFEIDRDVTTGYICWKYREWFQAATFTISESWLRDRPAPDIVVTRYGRHPSTGKLVPHDSCG